MEVREQLVESVLSFHHVGSRDGHRSSGLAAGICLAIYLPSSVFAAYMRTSVTNGTRLEGDTAVRESNMRRQRTS